MANPKLKGSGLAHVAFPEGGAAGASEVGKPAVWNQDVR